MSGVYQLVRQWRWASIKTITIIWTTKGPISKSVLVPYRTKLECLSMTVIPTKLVCLSLVSAPYNICRQGYWPTLRVKPLAFYSKKSITAVKCYWFRPRVFIVCFVSRQIMSPLFVLLHLLYFFSVLLSLILSNY